jgi:serine/threonine protein kinase
VFYLFAHCRGSFAVVKEGRHKATGTAVAIKIVDKKDAVFDPESLEQEVSPSFPSLNSSRQRERVPMLTSTHPPSQISTMKKVAHPNCVLLHEVYDESNKTYLVRDVKNKQSGDSEQELCSSIIFRRYV